MTLPTTEYTTDYLSVLNPEIDEYLLAHKSVGNNFEPLLGYGVYANIKVRKHPSIEGAWSYAREQTHSLLNPTNPNFSCAEKGTKIQGLLQFENFLITYVQQTIIEDTLSDRQQIADSGTLRGLGLYQKWSPDDYWYVVKEARYKLIEFEYTGNPLEWEKTLVLAEQSLRLPPDNPRGEAVPKVYTHQDFRQYRPLDPDKPELLPDSLVIFLNPNQLSLESELIEKLDKGIAADKPSQGAQTKTYSSPEFPLTNAELWRDPMEGIRNLKSKIRSNAANYISVRGY